MVMIGIRAGGFSFGETRIHSPVSSSPVQKTEGNAMVLARVEQTDEKLVIAPMNYISWDRIAFAAWGILIAGSYFLSLTHTSFFGIRLSLPKVNEIVEFSTPLMVIVVTTLRAAIRSVLWQWPGRAFVFERSPRPSGRVALQIRDAAHGSLLFRLSFVLPGPTGPDERKILEASVFSLTRVFDHNPFAVSRWEPYPADSLPTDATEYELVMLANLIHDYLGLQGPAPCKNVFPLPVPTAMERIRR